MGAGWRGGQARATRAALQRLALALGMSALAMSQAAAQRTARAIVWAMGAAPDLTAPYVSPAPSATQLTAKIYDGLLDYDADRRPRAALAEHWRQSPDGLTITFQLRQGVRFHDGKPFTSADVAYTILEVLRTRHPRGRAIFKHVTGVETPDPHTAVLRLDEPAPYLLNALAAHESPMLPKPLPAGAATAGKAEPALQLAGTGPFKLETRPAGKPPQLTRNESYWNKDLPRLAAIELRFVASESARLALAESGQAHVVSDLDTDSVHRSSSTSAARVRVAGADALQPIAALSLNTSRPPFDKPEVRQAIALALDKAAVITSTWHGFGRPAQGPIPAAILGTRPGAMLPTSAAAVAESQEHANRLLDAAGLVRREDGVRLELVHDVAPLGAEWQRLAETIEVQLAKIGLKIASRFETPAAWLQRIAGSGDYTMTSTQLHGFGDPAIALHRTLHSTLAAKPGPFGNAARWREAEADALMSRAMTELQPVLRSRLYRELSEVAVRAAPSIWLAELTPPVLVHRDLRHVMQAPFGLYGNFAEAFFFEPATATQAAAPALAATALAARP